MTTRSTLLWAAGGLAVGTAVAYATTSWLRSRPLDDGRLMEPLDTKPTKPPASATTDEQCDVSIPAPWVDEDALDRGSRAEMESLHAELADALRGCGAKLRHVTVQELTYLRQANEYAIPPRKLWRRMAKTVVLWEGIREEFGRPIVINSAYRDRAYNRVVGGQDKSQHLQASALDFAAQQSSLTTTLAKIVLTRFRRVGAGEAMGLGIAGFPQASYIHMDTGASYRVFYETRKWLDAR